LGNDRGRQSQRSDDIDRKTEGYVEERFVHCPATGIEKLHYSNCVFLESNNNFEFAGAAFEGICGFWEAFTALLVPLSSTIDNIIISKIQTNLEVQVIIAV
jgi:hypothetical protein